MRVIFAGSPEFAAVSLAALIEARESLGIQLVAVYSQPDRKAGRGQKLTPTPVKQLALEHELPVLTPLNFKADAEGDAAFETLAAFKPDLIIVAAYGLILPQRVLDLPKLGCVNLHASLLPRWRGAAPIHRAVLAGDTQTGITLMQMALGLDTGDMLAKSYVPITADTATPELHDALAKSAAQLLIDSLPKLQELQATAEPQDEAQANYAHKLTKEEGLIDWCKSAEQIDRQIRGLAGWPVAYSFYQGLGADRVEPKRVSIVAAKLPEPVQFSDQLQQLSLDQRTAGRVLGVTDDGLAVVCGDDQLLLIQRLKFAGKGVQTPHQAFGGRDEAGQFLSAA